MTSRTGASDVVSIAAFDAMLVSAEPVMVQLYSDTCMLCIVSKRSVDGMEHDLLGKVTVLRLDVNEDVGRAFARRYGLSRVPSFLVFTPDGRERYRESGAPDIERLTREALAQG